MLFDMFDMFSNMFIPKEPQFTVRLLGGDPFFFPTRSHIIYLDSKDVSKIFFCHKEFLKGKWVGNCLICKHYDDFHLNGPPHLYKKSQADFAHEMRGLIPQERYYYNVIVRQQEHLGPKVWPVRKMIHQFIMSSILGNSNIIGIGDVSHPISGNDLFIKSSLQEDGGILGTGCLGKFMSSSPLGTHEKIKEWIDSKRDLNNLKFKRSTESEMLGALEKLFGYLGAKSVKKYRSITEPFEPAW